MRLPKKAWILIKNTPDSWKLILPESFKKQGKHKKRITVHAGSEGQIIKLTLLYQNHLPTTNLYPIRIKKTERNTIRIGPLVGILSVLENDQLLGNKGNFIDLINMIRRIGGIGFVFTPEDIDWKEKQIHGRFYNTMRKCWVHHQVPFPDVVYNRIPHRKYEQQTNVISTLNQLKQIPHLHLFNPRFFNKWELYQILQETDLCDYLPDTKLLTDQDTLRNMLIIYPILFIKQNNNMAGNGIFRLEQKENHYKISTLSKGKEITRLFHSLDNLWKFLKIQVNKQEYIIQEAIPLLTYEGSPFDARILVQKNHEGRWEVTGIGFRLAGKHGITTHVPQGGKIIYADEALVPHFGHEQSEEILMEIDQIAVKIAETLEQHFHHLGEISLDLGITKDKTIWFIEANAKPMKFDEPEIRETSLQRFVDYCYYLSGFK